MSKSYMLNSVVLPFAVFSLMGTSASETATEPTTENAIEYKAVDRAEVLEKFLEKYNSPMVENVDTFVEVADTYGMDYRLLPAISCMESTCGRHLIEGTYNPFGWGIYGSNYIAFNSYDEAIRTVGKGISEGYIQKGLDTPERIAPVYTPPNPVGWNRGVRFFMGQMDEIAFSMK